MACGGSMPLLEIERLMISVLQCGLQDTYLSQIG